MNPPPPPRFLRLDSCSTSDLLARPTFASWQKRSQRQPDYNLQLFRSFWRDCSLASLVYLDKQFQWTGNSCAMTRESFLS